MYDYAGWMNDDQGVNILMIESYIYRDKLSLHIPDW